MAFDTAWSVERLQYQEEIIALKEERECLKAEIARLNRQLAEGIHIRGWWCQALIKKPDRVKVTCDTFNGCEKEELTECRHCGAAKHS